MRSTILHKQSYHDGKHAIDYNSDICQLFLPASSQNEIAVWQLAVVKKYYVLTFHTVSTLSVE